MSNTAYVLKKTELRVKCHVAKKVKEKKALN